jgi:hypothetical protein
MGCINIAWLASCPAGATRRRDMGADILTGMVIGAVLTAFLFAAQEA